MLNVSRNPHYHFASHRIGFHVLLGCCEFIKREYAINDRGYAPIRNGRQNIAFEAVRRLCALLWCEPRIGNAENL